MRRFDLSAGLYAHFIINVKFSRIFIHRLKFLFFFSIIVLIWAYIKAPVRA